MLSPWSSIINNNVQINLKLFEKINQTFRINKTHQLSKTFSTLIPFQIYSVCHVGNYSYVRIFYGNLDVCDVVLQLCALLPILFHTQCIMYAHIVPYICCQLQCLNFLVLILDPTHIHCLLLLAYTFLPCLLIRNQIEEDSN